MRIDFATLAFGYVVKSGGNTPNWATSLGQGNEYRINNSKDIDEMLKGVIYTSVPLSWISTRIGKGGKAVVGDSEDSPIIISSVFEKVYVNEQIIEDGKYIILITRDTSKSHAGRLRLKYGPSNTYNIDEQNKYSNEDFWSIAKRQLNIKDEACFFVYDISVRNQNELVLSTIFVNKDSMTEYESSVELHEHWEKLIKEHEGELNAKESPSLTFTTSHHSDAFPLNRIIFGAPGTGKSYRLDKEKETLIGSANDIDYERVTFHPDYTYAHFVGTYKPVPEKDATGAETITYKYVPGPFMRILVKALNNAMESEDRHRPFLLIIEEINRANVAAVFGDIFQLLDRGDDGVSEYPIEGSEDMKAYLARELGVEIDACSKIKLPNNLYIWATMNSADQGVFPMDTAFKRRWDFTYIGIDENEAGIAGKMVELPVRLKGAKGQLFEWNELRKEINRFLIGKGVNEDKLLGPYFIKLDFEKDASGVIDPNRIDPIKFSQTFKDKVIMYLFEDVKKGREELFNGCSELSKLYSTISRGFDEQGLGIFNGEIHAKVFPSDLP